MITRSLAEFVAGLTADSVPPGVVHQAKRTLLDWSGVALAGSRLPAAEIAYEVGVSLGGGGDSPVVGRKGGLSPPFAALANGIAAHVLDYDDTFNPGLTTVHGSAPVWPAALAADHDRRVDGMTALLALIAGFEVQTRVALAAGPAHYEAGWHVTGTVGHLGAAVAVAKALRLDVPRIVAALGSAGTQAAGIKAVYGSMGKALHAGKAAMDGLLAAHLAAGGYTSTTQIVEGRRGFLEVLTTGAVPERAVEGLGLRWLLLEDGFKAYACGSLTHPAIDAVLRLREIHGLRPDDVAAIEVQAHDYVTSTTGNPDPRTGLEAKFSVHHCVAVALIDGAARLAQFTDERVVDPEVVAVRRRVTVSVDPAVAKDAARVRMRLRDGRVVERFIEHNRGTPGNPMSDRELSEKFLDLAGPVVGGAAADRLVDLAWGFDRLVDIRTYAEALRGER
jgi:2-methylcitrate dehydratase PrpD